MTRDLPRLNVVPDTYRVSAEPVLLYAELTDALALCLHDELRGTGGLLHLRFIGGSGRPSDATDLEFSSLLVLLDRFKLEVLGSAPRTEDVQARILAHAVPSGDPEEPTASMVDLIQADLTDARITCGAQTLRRAEPVRVCFQPPEGRVWICATDAEPGAMAARTPKFARR